MINSDLELATHTELADELLKRSTFQGVIIYRTDDYRGQQDFAPSCNVFKAGLTWQEAIKLLRLANQSCLSCLQIRLTRAYTSNPVARWMAKLIKRYPTGD